MFTIKNFKNESVTSIKFDVNAVVLMKQTVSRSGDVNISVLQFPNCPDTKQTTIVKHLLKGMLAEFNCTENFNERYGFFETGVVVNGEKEFIKTGITERRKFSPFLSSAVIYKTDSTGKLSHAVKCDEGVTLRDTALNIKSEQLLTLFGYNSSQFRSALHHTALAVIEQCSFFSAVDNEMQAIDNGLAALAAEELKKQQEQEQEQKKQAQEQKKQKKSA